MKSEREKKYPKKKCAIFRFVYAMLSCNEHSHQTCIFHINGVFFFFLSLSTIRLFVHSLASEFWAVTRSDFCIETTNRIQCDTLFVLLLLLIWLERFVYKHGEQSFDCAFERPCSYHSDIPVVIDSFSLARYLPYVFMSRSSTNNNNRANWTQKLL